MNMEPLTHRLDRTVSIQAPPESVFRFFTDSERWARWWGAGSAIEAQPGGRVLVRYPNGIEALGEVLEVAPPERIVFTYGYAKGQPIPPGSSRVTIRLEREGAGTRLQLTHEFAEESARDQHVQGWRFQLSVFGNVVADEVFADAAQVVDAWYAAWTETDDRAREAAFGRIAAPGVRFRDRNSLLDSVSELALHAGAAQRYMPGVRLERRGEVRQCQGTVLSEWVAVGADGQERMSGTSVVVLGADGRIESVTALARS
jgi:uncharacterized protein YndB with AHSA1/START domain